jgi:D-serine deaminase-like pyridoxal phosphate-dependent protein
MSSQLEQTEWFEVADASEISSPALLVYRQRVEQNLGRMVVMADGPKRLRPHIKTHKMAEMLQLQLELGISKFKCATIAEAELAARTGVSDLLLAYQPVGPAIRRVVALQRQFQNVHFSVIADAPEVVQELSRAMQKAGPRSDHPNPRQELEVLVDLDIGQHRTGVAPGPEAVELYRLIASLPGLKPGGLHAYDGHLSDSDPEARALACEQAFGPVRALRHTLLETGLPVPRVVTGGTPTFGFHAQRGNVECSPGTCVFWDAGYGNKLRDLDFVPAALVLTRVVSKPGGNRLCLDLGHKAIGSEMPHPRVSFLNLQDAKAIAHNEEHLVVETDRSSDVKVGDCLYGVPWHVCPTVALHSQAIVIDGGRSVGVWKVAARDRCLTI